MNDDQPSDLVEVRFWTTAKEAALMRFSDDGALLLDEAWDEDSIYSGLFRTEEEARADLARREAAAKASAEVTALRRKQAARRAFDTDAEPRRRFFDDEEEGP